MAVDSVATKVKMQQHVFCRATRRLMRIRINFTYVTSLLDGVDVTARHYHARQHARGRGVAIHPVMRAWDRKPTSCQLFKPALFKPIPALYHWHAGREGLLSIPRVLQFGRPRPPSIYKNNPTPIQFVLAST